MPAKSKRERSKRGTALSVANEPDWENEAFVAQSKALFDRCHALGIRYSMSSELLGHWQSLPSATRKAILPEVRLHLATRFCFGLNDSTLVVNLSDRYGNNKKGMRNCRPALQLWLGECRKWLDHVVSFRKAQIDGTYLTSHQEDAWILLGSTALELPGALLKQVEIYCTEVHDPCLISWQHISSMMLTVEYVFDVFKSLPVLASASNPIAESYYFRNLSQFFDYVIGWLVLPCCCDNSSIQSVATVYGDRSKLDTFFISLCHSTKLIMFILCEFLKNVISLLDDGIPLELTFLNGIDNLFHSFANPISECTPRVLEKLLAKYYGVTSGAVFDDWVFDFFCVNIPHQPQGVGEGCNRSFYKLPTLLCTPSDVPACRCSEEKPSKRCLHYCWWFWSTVLSNLLPVLSDLAKTQCVVFDMLDLVMTSWCSEHLKVVEIVNSMTRLSKFTCNRFLLSSVRAIQKLASFCISTRIHLNVDKAVEELMCKSILGLSNFPFPVLSMKPADFHKAITLVIHLLYSPVQQYFEEEFYAIKKLQKLAQYERAVVGDYLSRKDWT